VGVGYKDVRNLEKVSVRQGMEVAQIKQDGALPVKKGDEQSGIKKRMVDEPWMERSSHGQSLPSPQSLVALGAARGS
jgi:hypothetical protein